MAEIVLAAQTGRAPGSRSAGRLRGTGQIPGVVYGQGRDAVPVAVEWRELRHVLLTDAGFNALINLEVDGDRQLTIVKEVQRHPVRRDITHVDFLRISRDEAISVEVPIALVGEAEKVARADGVIEHVLHSLLITAKPGAIPDELLVDITELGVNETIRVVDLALPAGVETDIDPEEPVVTGRVSTVAAELEDADAVAAEAAGGEGEGEGAGEGEGEGAGEASGDSADKG